MPKRKRSENDVGGKISQLKHELFQALKTTKGFERQRQAKRLREAKSDPKKTERVQREIVVLKSLDLQGAAHALLCSSLLRIKSIAESPGLPEEIKAGVSKPDISEEERVALHNVTSALYKYPRVREVVDKAIADVCGALGLPVPEKGGKRKREPVEAKQVEEAAEETEEDSVTVDNAEAEEAPDPRGASKQGKTERAQHLVADEELDEEQQERAVSLFEQMLGSSSEDEDFDAASDDEEADDKDPMEITSGEDEDDGLSDVDLDEDNEDDENDGDGKDGGEESEDALSTTKATKDVSGDASHVISSDEEGSPIPPPAKKAALSTKTAKPARVADSTFLPSLMGGYISGSESASDVDVAAPVRKNRRGQRARQAIWEKKYKDQAKHVQKTAGKIKDSGWDPKRGAVDENKGRPWKGGIRNPLDRSKRNENPNTMEMAPRKEKSEATGPLHPSWEAKKKAKEAQQTAKFEGKKITFD